MTDIVESIVPKSGTWKNRLVSPWAVVIAIPVAVFILDPANVAGVSFFAVKAFAGTLPYIAFAVFLIAWLKAAGAEALIANAFKGRELRMIFLAAMFGGLAPFCSCEVIPFIAGLLALGAPLSAVMAFWLSSPLIDPPTLFITAAALGWPFAVGKAISAVMLGLFGGLAIKFLAGIGIFAEPLRVRTSVGCGCKVSTFDSRPQWQFWKQEARREIFKSEFISNALFLIKWLALAYILEAMLVTYVPADMIAGIVGGEGIIAISTAAIVGMPAYLNGYVAPPLLAGLIDQGMSAGAAMAFMVAGSVSSVPAMAAVWSLVKPTIFASYLALGITGAIVSGAVFQLVN